jgi:hypothetical protein
MWASIRLIFFDQREDHLHTVGALVATVAEASLVALWKGRIAFKVRAGQIVEEHVELRAEQILPAGAQVLEEFGAMSEQAVHTAIEGVFGDLEPFDAEQITQAAAGQPVAMEPPFNARIKQAIGGEDLEESFPILAFAAGGQARRPDGVQVELLPELAGHPPGAPRTRAVRIFSAMDPQQWSWPFLKRRWQCKNGVPIISARHFTKGAAEAKGVGLHQNPFGGGFLRQHWAFQRSAPPKKSQPSSGC